MQCRTLASWRQQQTNGEKYMIIASPVVYYAINFVLIQKTKKNENIYILRTNLECYAGVLNLLEMLTNLNSSIIIRLDLECHSRG